GAEAGDDHMSEALPLSPYPIIVVAHVRPLDSPGRPDRRPAAPRPRPHPPRRPIAPEASALPVLRASLGQEAQHLRPSPRRPALAGSRRRAAGAGAGPPPALRQPRLRQGDLRRAPARGGGAQGPPDRAAARGPDERRPGSG